MISLEGLFRGSTSNREFTKSRGHPKVRLTAEDRRLPVLRTELWSICGLRDATDLKCQVAPPYRRTERPWDTWIVELMGIGPKIRRLVDRGSTLGHAQIVEKATRHAPSSMCPGIAGYDIRHRRH